MAGLKGFAASLKDGFKNLRTIPRDVLFQYRRDGIKVDEEGVWSFSPRQNPEYEWRLEPIGEEGEYLVAFYRNGVLLTEKLHMKRVT